MKNRMLIISIVGIILLISIFISAFSIKKKKLSGNNFSFQINKSGKCRIDKIYEMENYDVYTYCVDKIFVSDERIKVTLESFLKTRKETAINDIIENLKHEWAMFDGGTEKFSDESISLIKCKKIGKKEDVYIGPKNMELEEEFCNNDTK